MFLISSDLSHNTETDLRQAFCLIFKIIYKYIYIWETLNIDLLKERKPAFYNSQMAENQKNLGTNKQGCQELKTQRYMICGLFTSWWKKEGFLLAGNKRTIFAHTFVRSMEKVKETEISRRLQS